MKAISCGAHLSKRPISDWAGQVIGWRHSYIYILTTSGWVWAIVRPELGQAPHHLVVDSETPCQLNEGDQVEPGNEGLTIGTYHIALPHDVTLYEGLPDPTRLSHAIKRYPYLNHEILGTNQQIMALTNTLYDAWPEPSSLQRAALFLLGRGPGLTPMGDDVLAGFLSIMVNGVGIRPEYNRQTRILASIVAREAPLKTGNVSQAILTAALEGRLPEPALNFLYQCAYASNPDPSWLRSVGSTSGVCFEAGMCAAMSILSDME